MKQLNKLPQPLGGLIFITTFAFAFIFLPLMMLDNLGVLPKGGSYNQEQNCDYYATNC
jgi:hypothetical protein